MPIKGERCVSRICCKRDDVENSIVVEIQCKFPTVEDGEYDKVALDVTLFSLLFESHLSRLSEGLKTGMVGYSVGTIAGGPATNQDQLAAGVAAVVGAAAGDGSIRGGAAAAAGGRRESEETAEARPLQVSVLLVSFHVSKRNLCRAFLVML